MRLRSYLRGIGIGILIAAGICICASLRSGTPDKMTDEEVKARAKELGMTETSVLTDLSAAPTETVVEIIKEEPDVAPEQADETVSDQPLVDESSEGQSSEEEPEVTAEPEATPEPTPEAEVTPEPTPEPTQEVTPEPAKPSGDTVTITIEKGMGSDSVAKRLEAAGLVSNAHEYDVWLMQNGYDRIISAGAHDIPKGASNEEIAKIICNR